jgi:hypothetical protein
MDETTRPRTQGSLARQDASGGDFETDETDDRRATREGDGPRIAARTSAVVRCDGGGLGEVLTTPSRPHLTKTMERST